MASAVRASPKATQVACRSGIGDEWPGRTGFVHQAVLDDFADLSGYQVYACGGPAMIDVARKTFTETRGLPPEAFFADSFTYAVEK